MSKLFLALLLGLLPVNIMAKTLNVCIDDDWYPYTFSEKQSSENKAVGLHVDIVKKAIASLDDTVSFTALPWKRCLKFAKIGKVDAAMSASYKDERAAYTYYPDDAKTEKKSAGRIDQVENILITRISDPYEFDGNWATIPQPVGVGGLGSSITPILEKQGILVLENNTKTGGLQMLKTKRVNAVVFNPLQAKDFNTRGRFKNQLKIHKIPLKSRSYHLIFSKKSSITQGQRNEIWSALVKVRQDEIFMLNSLNKYDK